MDLLCIQMHGALMQMGDPFKKIGCQIYSKYYCVKNILNSIHGSVVKYLFYEPRGTRIDSHPSNFFLKKCATIYNKNMQLPIVESYKLLSLKCATI